MFFDPEYALKHGQMINLAIGIFSIYHIKFHLYNKPPDIYRSNYVILSDDPGKKTPS